MKLLQNALLGIAAAAVFSLLYLLGALTPLGDRLYDFFLNFRSNRERIDSVVFLDVDDQAIAYYGFFPWPRSITADGLLRLKEYGARAAIFDIEYIDRGPQGVDSLYLEQGLAVDFNRSFSEISAHTQDIFSAIREGRMTRNDVPFFSNSLSELISGEWQSLFKKAQGVARDNDLYLAQALALYGHSWSTLNLRDFPLSGEQAERRPMAEERFSYQVSASHNAHKGAGFIDILPALPIFAGAAKGAGYTNVEIDDDGIRRRIYLTQNILDHWYLQLAFAPLIDYFGNPEIILEKNKLTIKQAKLPGGRIKDIEIPLDHRGRMMLDWPKEDYRQSYDHISFADFNLLDEIEMEIERYSRALYSAELSFFIQHEPSLITVPVILEDMAELFDAAHENKSRALENTSSEAFAAFIEYRDIAYELLAEIIALDTVTKIRELSARLCEERPEIADDIESEAEYIILLIDALKINLEKRNELSEYNNKLLRDKFVILGRVDTGTTDYGANPFYGKYVNVGTHGVVLDTILSETFIIPLGLLWKILFMAVFIPLLFIISGRLSPVLRASSGFVAALIILAVTVVLFRFFGVFFGPLGFIFALISAIIIREILAYNDSEKEKHFIRTAFSTYVSHDVVKEIISDPSRLQLGGTKRHMTAIFTDVRGFSTISEKLDPEELVSLLNRYLSAMSDVILSEKGTIDKYEGDAIIAFFGAPIDLPDHALRACISAIKMKKIEEELNKTVMENNISAAPLLTRIGINTGNMVAGNMGTANKMNYTIMGNAVNLASRLEGVNKQYGTWILASEYTVLEAAAQIQETKDNLLYRKLDRVRVVGINEPVRLCELLDTNENATDQQKKLVSVFHEALNYFELRQWTQAAEGFKEAISLAAEDHPSIMYLERAEKFISAPPPDAWDGVYNLTSK